MVCPVICIGMTIGICPICTVYVNKSQKTKKKNNWENTLKSQQIV